MIFRTADLSDIKQMQVITHLVKENTLSNPDLVPDKDVAYYITEKGKGWVCEIGKSDCRLQHYRPHGKQRAERFYALQGWTQVGSYKNGELKFELSYTDCAQV